jgi:hypothetical protein
MGSCRHALVLFGIERISESSYSSGLAGSLDDTDIYAMLIKTWLMGIVGGGDLIPTRTLSAIAIARRIVASS